MKRISILLVVLLIAATPFYAQEVKPDVTEGTKGILFEFDGLSFLSASAYNGGIGAKYYVADKLAARVVLIFNHVGITDPANPGTGQDGKDGEASATSFGAGLGVEYHPLNGRANPYVGAVVGFATTSTDYKPSVVGTAPLTQPERKNSVTGETINGTTYQAGTTFTVGAVLGFEYFITKELSLGAEYQLSFSSISQKDEEVTAGSTTYTTKGGSGNEFGITNSGRITLSVYF
jgi:hypothetical protein